jgi:hypothetical protein
MAKQYLKSTPMVGGYGMYDFKELLKTCGWIHQASGNGNSAFSVTPGNVNDVITLASRFLYTGAWWVGKCPDGQRHVLFQRGTTHLTWRIAYSYSAGFTGGVPSITVPPTATDAKDVIGNVTPTYYQLFDTDGLYRLKAMAQDTAPYGFWLFGHTIGLLTGGYGPFGSTGFFMDPLKSGSYPASDVDPYVFSAWTTNSGCYAYKTNQLSNEVTTPTQGCWAYLKKGLAGEGWASVQGLYYRNINRVVIPGIGTNPANGKDDLLPMIYARPAALSAPVGYKGISSFFQWLSTTRGACETLTKTTARDKIVLGDVVGDWDGTVPEV